MNKKINFCTLFNSHYLSRGIALYNSIKRNCPNFHLYIFSFDDITTNILRYLDRKHVTIITLAEFEDKELLKVKPARSEVEYCWTCTPSTVLYCLKNYNLENCTYIDADLYFYSDPGILLDELSDKDVSIIAHKYSKNIIIDYISALVNSAEMENKIYKQIDGSDKKLIESYYKKNGSHYDLIKKQDWENDKDELSKVRNILYNNGHNLFSDFGTYCVQFMTFKNNENGLKVLNDWRNACIDWCYEKVEDGKFGDQKFLDNWLTIYDCVKELENKGAGIAPWNINSYNFTKEKEKIFISANGEKDEIVFFHYAGLKFYHYMYTVFNLSLFKREIINLYNKDFGIPDKNIYNVLYKEYIIELKYIGKELNKIIKNINYNSAIIIKKRLENFIRKKIFKQQH